MTYRSLGATGIPVSPLCLGTMMFGSVGGSGVGKADHAECIEIVHAALEAGINFVDTADMYSAGESEVIVGKALAGRRDDVVLSTKAHFPMGEAPGRSGNSRRWLVRAVEESLRRLQTDWIDVYFVHRPDDTTAIEETLRALDAPGQQRVRRLLDAERQQVAAVGDGRGGDDALGLEGRAAVRADLASGHQVVERAQGLLDRGRVVRPVHEVDVDPVGLEPAQAVLDGAHQPPP